MDTQFIENNHKNLKNAYRSKGIWNEINEKIQIQNLSPLLKDFIEDYITSQDTEIPTTINLKDKKLFGTTQSLLDKMDTVMSKSTRERNDSDDRPVKKPDIFGTYSNRGYN
ncbi:14765_t:CDS:2 [Gigaspora margarita]|uniref:14765_t:CDS:1 n=1 Tax=Gigaspora margarita TaxID=4874 RepID=A0ABN7VH45_GIGMA|nr:14765_t:CDS:2 [Gigaspora margarita]